MTQGLWNTVVLNTVAIFAVLLPGAVGAVADEGQPDRTLCAAPRSLHEVAEDETRTISELCRWRDDALRSGTEREMTLTVDVTSQGLSHTALCRAPECRLYRRTTTPPR